MVEVAGSWHAVANSKFMYNLCSTVFLHAVTYSEEHHEARRNLDDSISIYYVVLRCLANIILDDAFLTTTSTGIFIFSDGAEVVDMSTLKSESKFQYR